MVSKYQRPDWVVRANDPQHRGRAEVTAIVTEALVQAGFDVLSVQPPLELNPQPLRIHTQTPTQQEHP